MAWREIIYEYDGSFEGLLCCVFESYTQKERPTAILRDGDDEPSLFAIRAVATDRAHARRIYRSLFQRSPEVGPFLRRAFLTCMPDKEMAIYRFIVKFYREGAPLLSRLSDDSYLPLLKAVRLLSGEVEQFRGFTRFSDFDGVLGAEIEPKNRVLPMLRRHFCERYHNETFFLYDRTHREALLYSGGVSRIVPLDVFMANMDKCISFLDKNGNEIYEKFSNDIEEFRKKCDKLHNIHIPGKELIGTNDVFDVDLSKLIINSNMGGKPMNDILRKKFHLEMEMEAAKYVLAITTFCDNKEGFDRLYKALDYIDAQLKKNTNKSEIKKIKNTNFELVRNIQEMSISNAVNSNTKLVDIENAINKVSAEYLYLYPPGIPLIVPGEVVNVKLVEQIKEYKNRNYEIVRYDKFKIVD